MAGTGAATIEVAPSVDAPPLASWSRRVIAALLDGAILGGATWLVLGVRGVAPSLTPVFGSAAEPEAITWFTSPWLVGLLVTMLALQGWTGATPGKRVAGVAVVRAVDGRPAGLLASAARVVAHLVDAILVIGYLRPLWNGQNRTFADSMVGTLAIQTREPAPHPWFAGLRRAPSAAGSTVVSVGAVVLCALGVGFSVTSASWGGEWDVSLPCTDDGTVAAPTAEATTARVGGSVGERRLWVARSGGDRVDSGLHVTWTWTSPDLQVDRPRAETEVRRRDGSTIQESQELAITSEGGSTIVFQAATVPAGDLADAGPGWSAQTRLVVGEEVVGSCTVESTDWAAANVGAGGG